MMRTKVFDWPLEMRLIIAAFLFVLVELFIIKARNISS